MYGFQGNQSRGGVANPRGLRLPDGFEPDGPGLAPVCAKADDYNGADDAGWFRGATRAVYYLHLSLDAQSDLSGRELLL